MSNSIRELSEAESLQVNGGVLPVLAAIGSFVGHAGARSVGKYVFTRAMTTYAVYGAADSLKDVSDN